MNKELALKLIKLYLNAINEVRGLDHFGKIKNYLRLNHLNHGICDVAKRKWGARLLLDDWVQAQCLPHFLYWAAPPESCLSKARIIAALERRVEILKTYPGVGEINT